MLLQNYTTTLGTASTVLTHSLGREPSDVKFTPITNANGNTNSGFFAYLRSNPTSASNGIVASAGVDGLNVRVLVVRWSQVIQPNFALW